LPNGHCAIAIFGEAEFNAVVEVTYWTAGTTASAVDGVASPASDASAMMPKAMAAAWRRRCSFMTSSVS
jgi:hypothetical protein